MEILGETVGTIVLLGLVGGIGFAFYKILKYMFDGIRKNDD